MSEEELSIEFEIVISRTAGDMPPYSTWQLHEGTSKQTLFAATKDLKFSFFRSLI